MHGIQYIKLYNKRYSYEIKLNRKITVIRGNSGTGKTTLARMASDAIRNRGVKNKSTLQLRVPVYEDIAENVNYIENSIDSIVIIDEDTPGLLSKQLCEAINKSECYFVIITRDNIHNLAYSVNSVYELFTDSKHIHMLRALYKPSSTTIPCPSKIICEDEKSGYIFFKLLDTNNKSVQTAMGKSNVVNLAIAESSINSKTTIVADGAAFGPHIDDLFKCLNLYNISAYLPESFEFVLLHSVIFRDNENVQYTLENYLNNVDTSFITEERFFTSYIDTLFKEIGLSYSKKSLRKCFVLNCCCIHETCKFVLRDRSISKLNELLNIIPIDMSKIFICSKFNTKTIKENETSYYI